MKTNRDLVIDNLLAFDRLAYEEIAADYADDALWDELHAHFTPAELAELGFFIALTSGQQRWLKTLNLGHREVLADTSAGLAAESPAEA